MKILFVAGFGPIVNDQQASENFYMKTLGLEFESDGEYHHTEKIAGVKHFALWPLSHAAEECFGTPHWPANIAIPQSWLEFDVEDIDSATEELVQQGYSLLVSAKTQPWKQIVTRMISPEGMLVSIAVTPWMRDDAKEPADA